MWVQQTFTTVLSFEAYFLEKFAGGKLFVVAG
jgi:hypothetical protein